MSDPQLPVDPLTAPSGPVEPPSAETAADPFWDRGTSQESVAAIPPAASPFGAEAPTMGGRHAARPDDERSTVEAGWPPSPAGFTAPSLTSPSSTWSATEPEPATASESDHDLDDTRPLGAWLPAPPAPPNPSSTQDRGYQPPPQPAFPGHPVALTPLPHPGFAAASGSPTVGYPQHTPGRHGSPRGPNLKWPLLAALALLLGLVGGFLGSELRLSTNVAGTQPGSRGLDPNKTVNQPPLTPSSSEAGSDSVAAVAEELLPSTVQILAEYDGEAGGATGSGFVLDTDGHVITNNHVVANAAETDGRIQVVDYRGNRLDATIVGRSPVYDIAVLQVRRSGKGNFHPAALGASQKLRVGESVVAFGAPLGLSQTVTSGIVSALNRPVTTGTSSDDSSYINAVQTDAAINPGNSGGPLVNLSGEVVGVNSAIASTGGQFGGQAGNIGVGFAIPIEQVRTTADQILRTGEASYPIIGATVDSRRTNTGGALIDQVTDGGPAQRAGVQSKDIVVAIDGQRVSDGISLIVLIRTHVPGQKVELTLLRNGQARTVAVTLAGETG